MSWLWDSIILKRNFSGLNLKFSFSQTIAKQIKLLNVKNISKKQDDKYDSA